MAGTDTAYPTTIVVPFDGTELAETALRRAVQYGNALDEAVVTVSVVTQRSRYTREKGRIDEGEDYDVEAVVDGFRGRVRELVPDDAIPSDPARRRNAY